MKSRTSVLLSPHSCFIRIVFITTTLYCRPPTGRHSPRSRGTYGASVSISQGFSLVKDGDEVSKQLGARAQHQPLSQVARAG